MSIIRQTWSWKAAKIHYYFPNSIHLNSGVSDLLKWRMAIIVFVIHTFLSFFLFFLCTPHILSSKDNSIAWFLEKAILSESIILIKFLCWSDWVGIASSQLVYWFQSHLLLSMFDSSFLSMVLSLGIPYIWSGPTIPLGWSGLHQQ